MPRFFRMLLASVCIAASLMGGAGWAEARDAYRIGWSPRAAYAVWGLAEARGVLQAEAARQGVAITLERFDTQREAIDAYRAGRVDGLAIAAVEALWTAILDVEQSHFVVLTTGFSNGADAIVARGVDDIASLRQASPIVKTLTPAQYLLDRCLETAGLNPAYVPLRPVIEQDLDEEIAKAGDVFAVATWSPKTVELEAQPGVRTLCDSSALPGEMTDWMLVRSDVAIQDPRVPTALAATWYAAVALIMDEDAESAAARAEMTTLIGLDPGQYEAAFRGVRFFETVEGMISYLEGGQFRRKISNVRRFVFLRRWFGDDAVQTLDDIGLLMADGIYVGDPRRTLMIFDTSFATDAVSR